MKEDTYFLTLDYSPYLISWRSCNNFNIKAKSEFLSLCTIVHFRLDNSLLGWGELSCALWMFSSILALYQLHANSTDSLFVTTETISRNCQMSRGGVGEIAPGWIPLSIIWDSSMLLVIRLHFVDVPQFVNPFAR